MVASGRINGTEINNKYQILLFESRLKRSLMRTLIGVQIAGFDPEYKSPPVQPSLEMLIIIRMRARPSTNPTVTLLRAIICARDSSLHETIANSRNEAHELRNETKGSRRENNLQPPPFLPPRKIRVARKFEFPRDRREGWRLKSFLGASFARSTPSTPTFRAIRF